MSQHVDLDALADLLDDETAEGAAHVETCSECRSALAELRRATAQVSRDLAALPAAALPDDVRDRIDRALADDGAALASVTTLPAARTSPGRRWLPAAAAVVLLLAGAGYGLSRLGGNGDGTATSSAGRAADSAAGAAELGVVRNDTGTDYTGRDSLATALPQLLTGAAADTATVPKQAAPLRGAPPGGASSPATSLSLPAPADPLARLRDNAGLADCLLALLPPDDPSVRPLALDYATFKGTPALVVVLPGALPNKLDVFVVGAGCSRANDSTLFYTSVDKP